ncbi:hypothetical protein CVN56_03995 [Rhodococcus sp. AQ5-07]|nr:hypothetical protein CVN56_03995 [Rhodococcus sp. AQ5-07]
MPSAAVSESVVVSPVDWVAASAAAWVSAPVQASESEAPSAASSTWSATSQQPSALRLPSAERSVPTSAQPSAPSSKPAWASAVHSISKELSIWAHSSARLWAAPSE